MGFRTLGIKQHGYLMVHGVLDNLFGESCMVAQAAPFQRKGGTRMLLKTVCEYVHRVAHFTLVYGWLSGCGTPCLHRVIEYGHHALRL